VDELRKVEKAKKDRHGVSPGRWQVRDHGLTREEDAEEIAQTEEISIMSERKTHWSELPHSGTP